VGVSTHLYIDPRTPIEAIGVAWARAVGVNIPLINGENNLYSGGHFIKATHSLTMWELDATHGITGHYPSLHLTDGPLGSPAWMLSGGSWDGTIAVFEAIASALGGVLVYRDTDGKAAIFPPPPDIGLFENLSKAAFGTELAVITAHPESAYCS
jgi:hypothetical protein